jgi:hypothetical protein
MAFRTRLDRAALQYAQLLADPCNGPLVTAPFGDGQGGIVARYEVDIVLNGGATDNGSYIVFIPSLLQFYTAAAAVTADSALIASGAAQLGPGYGPLVTNGLCSAYRVLSACLQVYYPGSESTRAGITAVGQVPQANVGGSNSTSFLRTSSQYTERTPVDHIEIKWMPNTYDMEWVAPAFDGGTTFLTNRRSALVSSTYGIPISTGMRYRMVAVIEWLPTSGQGTQANPSTRVLSNNTYTDVLKFLEDTGHQVYAGALQVGKTASSLYAAAKTVQHVAYGTAKLAALTMG